MNRFKVTESTAYEVIRRLAMDLKISRDRVAAILRGGIEVEALQESVQHLITFEPGGWAIIHPRSCRAATAPCGLGAVAARTLPRALVAELLPDEGTFEVALNDVGDRVLIGDLIGESSLAPAEENLIGHLARTFVFAGHYCGPGELAPESRWVGSCHCGFVRFSCEVLLDEISGFRAAAAAEVTNR
ncbi:hypothetical protein J2S43_007882 [Catenuloplanes nepalensis]|uniref:Uncharacterized protein n=2 Tax=Catenuloplanes nepalensis TaxID=587533 RepID=A0ABT9N6P3_9ACTN|nr:hypothetical protein [Catenuloplanes nepalensis]